MTYARPVLSPHAHARIVSIDTAGARGMPGVVAVLTEADLATHGKPMNSRPSAVLARDSVVFTGQPVAVVVAETEEQAQDAAEAVFVEYEPLPPVLDPEEAMREDAPLVHTEGLVQDDEGVQHAAVETQEEETTTPANVHDHAHFHRGDAEAGLREADVVVRRRYRTSTVHQSYMEPHASVASYDPVRKEMRVFTSTQGQYAVRDLVARLLGLQPSRVRVTPMTVGGGFGAKYGIIDPLAAAASMAVRRPVKLVLSRTEDFLSTTPSPATIIDLELGVSAERGVTGLRARAVVDDGAYPMAEGGILSILLGGYYRCDNVDIEAFDVLTTKQPAGAYRAPGAPPATFALEQAVDEALRQLGLDPIEWRLKHVAGDGDAMGSGQPWPSLGLRNCLERLREHPLWQERSSLGPDEGLGLAIGAWPGAANPAAALVCMGGEGSVQVHVGSVDISGVNSSLVLVAAEVLQMDPAQIELVQDDTQSGLRAGPSGGSQTTYSVSGAVRRAAEEVRRQLLDLATHRLEAAVEDLELRDGAVQVKGVPSRAVPAAELALMAQSQGGGAGPITGQGRAAIEVNAPGSAAHLVKVRVDRDTGSIDVLAYAAVQDVGFALNPLMVEGQIEGGSVQGLGWGLSEAMHTDGEGQVTTASFIDYVIPSIDTAPQVDVALVENPSEHGLHGARVVGEPPIVPGGAAVANAVAGAVGVRITELPLTPIRVWEALRD
ncbi:MAG: xanthine dehydrogenase family protein molybdopterin-binding subunit [Candidatus Dormibacteraeota bacterium]|nr:xanthine dehydrogenase family protein molybdopterin-binding subunit [Candidatus Dormibacteraeota bacterium]